LIRRISEYFESHYVTRITPVCACVRDLVQACWRSFCARCQNRCAPTRCIRCWWMLSTFRSPETPTATHVSCSAFSTVCLPSTRLLLRLILRWLQPAAIRPRHDRDSPATHDFRLRRWLQLRSTLDYTLFDFHSTRFYGRSTVVRRRIVYSCNRRTRKHEAVAYEPLTSIVPEMTSPGPNFVARDKQLNWIQQQHAVTCAYVSVCRPVQGRRSWGVGGLDPWKYVGGVRVCFDSPKNVTFFHSKLLLDNSASLTSSRMKDLCQSGR